MTHKLRNYWPICFLLLLYSNSLLSQTHPHVINFSKIDYQASNKNWSITQDKDGFVYFGNDAGILSFDGVQWRHQQLPNQSIVRSVDAFSHERIYVGGYEEFGYWQRNISGNLDYVSLAERANDKAKFNNDFWKIISIGNCTYFQSFGGIYVYYSDKDILKRVETDKAFLFLHKVNDELWIQEMLGPVYKIDGEKLIKIEGSEVFKGTDVRVILPNHSGNTILGTARRGVYIYDGNSFKEWNKLLSSEFASKELNCGIKTKKGTFLFGTISDGIYEVDSSGNIIAHFSTTNGLQNNTVLSLFEDKTENIWVGLDKGIDLIKYWKNANFYIDYGARIGSVYDATVWNGFVFIGTNQGVYYTNQENLHRQDLFSTLKLLDGTQGQVWALKIIDNKLYCCHNRGLMEIGNSLSVSTKVDAATGVYDIKEESINGKKVKLLSTYLSVKIVDENNHLFDLSDVQRGTVVRTEVDHLGNVWLEHPNKGVTKCKFKNDFSDFEKAQTYGNGLDGLPYQLAIFKVGGRIMLVGNGMFYTYNDINGTIVPSNILNDCFEFTESIKRVVHVKENVFWALTNSTVYKFFYDGYDARILERYNIGKNNLSLVSAYENISVSNDSLNFICLDNGFLLYKATSNNYENKPSAISSPKLEYVAIMNKNKKTDYCSLHSKAVIPYNFNTIQVGFSAASTFSDDLYFQYKLDGIDSDWSIPAKINQVVYERLPQGEYTLMLRIHDNLGNHSEATSYSIEVRPPWFLSLWAYALYVLLFILSALGIWNLVLKRYRNKHLLKVRHRETLRLRRINRELQEQVDAKNAELLSQTSFIIQRNELIVKIKDEIETFAEKNNNKAIIPLFHKISVMLNKNMDAEEDWKMFLIKFEEKHKGFFQRLKNGYPQLTPTDLRLCACLRLNLDSKEIASLVNVSVRAVENSRYRIRKKMNIPPNQNLNDFFMGL